MIPKIIHYCWLSKDPLPIEAQECIKSWKRHMPDWKLKLWNMDSFDIHSVPFVEEAVSVRKWAFAADYIRTYALYTEGGVYLDSDVVVRRNLDFVLKNKAFSAIEYIPNSMDNSEEVVAEMLNLSGQVDMVPGVQIQAAIIGGEKGHPFFKECLDYYDKAHFLDPDGVILPSVRISPIVFAEKALKYGFILQDKEQLLEEDFMIYPSDLFCSQPYLMKDNAVAVHCCNGSWRHSQTHVQRIVNRLKTFIKTVLYDTGIKKGTLIDKIN